MWASSDSVIWRPMVSTGFSDVIGSWNTMPMPGPRTERSSERDMPMSSRPSKTALPVICAGGDGTSPSSDITLTLFPLPDSPTMASVSPARTSQDTPLTTSAGPRRVRKLTRRSRTDSTGASSSPLPGPRRRCCWSRSCGAPLRVHRRALPWVEGVAQGVAHHVQGQHEQEDGQAGEHRDPPGALHEALALAQHAPPGGSGWLGDEPQEQIGRAHV